MVLSVYWQRVSRQAGRPQDVACAPKTTVRIWTMVACVYWQQALSRQASTPTYQHIAYANNHYNSDS